MINTYHSKRMIRIKPIALAMVCLLCINTLAIADQDTLTPSLISDPDIDPARSAAVRNSVAQEAKPGAIGNGEPLVCLLKGELPPRIALSPEKYDELAGRLRTAIRMAIQLYSAKIDSNQDAGVRCASRRAAQNLISFNLSLSRELYPFNASVQGPEGYLIGFSLDEFGREEKAALAVDFIDWLFMKYQGDRETALLRLAQYVFHERTPEKTVIRDGAIDRSDHRLIYTRVQGAIFGDDEVQALKRDLREFIDGKVSRGAASRGIEALIRDHIPAGSRGSFDIPNLPLRSHREGPALRDHLQAMLNALDNAQSVPGIPAHYRGMLSDPRNRAFFEQFILLHDIGKAGTSAGDSYAGHEQASAELIRRDPSLAGGLAGRDLLIEVIGLHGLAYDLCKGDVTAQAVAGLIEKNAFAERAGAVMPLLIACVFLDAAGTHREAPSVGRIAGLARAYDILQTVRRGLPVAKDLVRQAGGIVEGYRKRLPELTRHTKADDTIVTEADTAVQDVVLSGLAAAFPGHQFLGEESAMPDAARIANKKNASSPFMWVVDPIDGTRMFADPESRYFGTMIGLMYEGHVVMSVFLAPEYEVDGVKGALFEASELDDGVFLNGEPVRVRAPDAFSQEAVVVSSKAADAGAYVQPFGSVIGESRSETLSLALIAAGSRVRGPVGNVYHKGGKVWDAVFGGYFVEKAGGVFVYPDGRAVLPVARDILAGPAYEMPEVFYAGSRNVVDELMYGAAASALGMNMAKARDVSEKNAVNEGYGVTVVSGYPFSAGARAMLEAAMRNLDAVAPGVVNWQPVEAVHATVSSVVRTKEGGSRVTGDDLGKVDLAQLAGIVSGHAGYDITFNRIQLMPDGNIVVIAESGSSEIEQVKKDFAERARLAGKYKVPAAGEKVKFYSILGYVPVERLRSLAPEQAARLKEAIDGPENQPSLAEHISALAIVHYSHRTLRSAETVIPLPIGQPPVQLTAGMILGSTSSAAETVPEATASEDSRAVNDEDRRKAFAGQACKYIAGDLPVRAQVFKANLARILAAHPDQLFFIGIETDIGEPQKAQIMPIYKAIDEIRDMQDPHGKPLFPNLMVRRAKARELATIAGGLNREGTLNLNNAFIGARKASVDNKMYDEIGGEGRAWISAIDDSNPGDYLPVFEAITLNMMAYLNADAKAIKEYYDAISEKPVDPAALQDMLKKRVLYILPKITALDGAQLRDLYELARRVYTAA